MGTIILSETLGTMLLTLLGCGVVANHLLTNTKGRGGGFLMVNIGWGIAVLAGVYAATRSGAHLNPAVTLGILVSGADAYAPGVDITVLNTIAYFLGEFLGGFLGGVLCWLAYRQHFDKHENAAEKLGVFSTGPQYRNVTWNLVTEIIATFVLVFVILSFTPDSTPAGFGPIAVALLVVGIGASLGGPTGYAINPARDMGPRLAHAVVPIKGKGSNDWGYSWIPVVGPIVGGVAAGLIAQLVKNVLA